ncbi:MAG: hypothetical protein CMJ18_17380 [Phycisphaeraceae bacterium]|nr:hypothetical protein [Phycisphaeraceae bacterium]
MSRPLIGITVDNRDNNSDSQVLELSEHYGRAVTEAGGVPILLPHEPDLAAQYAETCDGLIFSGGVDPRTEIFGAPTHPRARPIDARRQAFELALLKAVADRDDKCVLGVCLGMQLMALAAGGTLDQYLPEHLATAAQHTGRKRHGIELLVEDSVLGPGSGHASVVSHHQQAVADPGSMRVVARAPDGVIEAIDDPARRFYAGVQWHPERGGPDELNRGLFARLVRAATSERRRRT